VYPFDIESLALMLDLTWAKVCSFIKMSGFLDGEKPCFSSISDNDFFGLSLPLSLGEGKIWPNF
jgi:hypothetical protein